MTNAACQRLGGGAGPTAPRDGSQPHPEPPALGPSSSFPQELLPLLGVQGGGGQEVRQGAHRVQGTEEIYTHILLGTFLTELGRNGHQIAFFIDLHYYGRWPLHFLPGGARIKGIKD